MRIHILSVLFISLIACVVANKNAKSNVIEDINDIKEIKKIFRTKNNVLVLFTSDVKKSQNAIKVFREASNLIKGQGTTILVDCTHSEAKKTCKKLKANPQPVVLKHYKDGDFHKDYDRQMIATSIVNFMRDPTGDLPWEEDPAGVDVHHVPDPTALSKLLKKETKPVMVMFYAPWCGFCKQMKPDYSQAATELKQKAVLAAIDVNRSENSVIRKLYNITGFPTLLYYEHNVKKHVYEGENNKESIVAFMNNPNAAPKQKPKEEDWSSETNSEIVHLTSTSFEPALKDEKSVLVMFYAPWCGHCKKMKPEYEKAATIMKEQQIYGVLAAVDATKENSVAAQFGVKGYPTVKYFVNGEFKFDVRVREADKIVEFMKNPSEPPPPPPPETPWEDQPSNVVHLNDETFKTFLKKKKHVLVMFYAPWCGHCKKAKPEFVAAAETYKDDPRVELAAVDCTRHTTLCSSYSVQGYPTIKYFSYLKTSREYNGGRTAADFEKFLADPDAPPEKPAPAEFGTYPGSDSIAILTDDTFEATAKTAKKMLVMFYATWCGHCTNMKPHFSEAAKKLADEGAGLLVAVEHSANPNLFSKYEIKGFPTLKYFENGVYVKDYNGKRTTEDIYNFVKNSGNSKDEL